MRVMKNKEFNLSEEIWQGTKIDEGYSPEDVLCKEDVKEFIKRRLNFKWKTFLINGQFYIKKTQVEDFIIELEKEAGEKLNGRTTNNK